MLGPHEKAALTVKMETKLVWSLADLWNSAGFKMILPVSRMYPRAYTAACGDVAPPVIDVTCGCLLRSPVEEDRGHRQTCVRLSKATWGNIIASRCNAVKGQRRKEKHVSLAQRFAQVFGAIYLLVGILGFIPPLLVGVLPTVIGPFNGL